GVGEGAAGYSRGSTRRVLECYRAGAGRNGCQSSVPASSVVVTSLSDVPSVAAVQIGPTAFSNGGLEGRMNASRDPSGETTVRVPPVWKSRVSAPDGYATVKRPPNFWPDA